MSTISTKRKPAFTCRAIAGALFASAVISTSFPVDAAPLPATHPGAFDPTFNGGATMHQPMFTRDDFAMAVHVQADGKTVMSGYGRELTDAMSLGYVARYNADGSLDTAFNGTGVRKLGNATIVITGTYQNPALAKGERSQANVLRLNADGTLDMAFGLARLGAGYGNGVRVQADGAIVYFGEGANANKDFVPMAARVLANGQPDLSFGAGGKVLTAPLSKFSTLTAVAIGADNRMTFSGYAQAPGDPYRHAALTRLIGTETTTNVIEFYNTQLNHYFVTADPNEASAIDAGTAGAGWSRTGAQWKSGGPLRVCRFYGSPEVSPKTGARTGPNGHFYTISADECALVKDDAGWKFESYDFSGWPKAADGNCAAGTVAVKRVYNNRFAVNDSNHRYATSDAIYDQMVASGWSGEGAVFCAPQ